MKFDEALAATVRPTRRNKLALILDELPVEEATAIRTALDDPLISCERIRLALALIGIDVGRSTIERWRNDNSVR